MTFKTTMKIVIFFIFFIFAVTLSGSLYSDEIDALDAPHDASNNISCPDCHVPFGAVAEPVPRDWISEQVCKSCHIEAGVAIEVDYHASPAYGDTLFCQDCHNPHQHQEDYQRYYMTEEIYPANGGLRRLAFQDSTDFIHGAEGVYRAYDGVCEVCHTQTAHHRNDGNAPQQSHNDAANCLDCHPHEDGFRATGGSCLDCHAVLQPGVGQYRRIVADTLGEAGDFARTSHHYEGLITEADCSVCHFMGLHRSLPDPQVIVLNADTGDTIRYTGDPETVESHCEACHDGNGANGDLSPFSDDIIAPDIITGWTDASHNTGGAANGGYSCMGDGTTGCHSNAHGSDKNKLLGPDGVAANGPSYAEEEEGFCYNCHDGDNGEAADITAEFQKASVHPVTLNPRTHDSQEGPAGQNPAPPQFLPEQDVNDLRHVECVDCHNPHAVSDVDPGGGINGALTENWGIGEDGNMIDPATREYQICLKCHGDSQNLPADQTNKRDEFNTNNASYHPVFAQGANPDVPGLQGGWSENSVMDCSDCHNNNDGGGLLGVHGSTYSPILKARFETVAGNYSAARYALCFICHNENTLRMGGQSHFRHHNKHIRNENASCFQCHNVHGSANENHLIFLDPDNNSIEPASGGRLEYNDLGNNRGECYVTCHGKDHNPKNY